MIPALVERRRSGYGEKTRSFWDVRILSVDSLGAMSAKQLLLVLALLIGFARHGDGPGLASLVLPSQQTCCPRACGCHRNEPGPEHGRMRCHGGCAQTRRQGAAFRVAGCTCHHRSGAAAVQSSSEWALPGLVSLAGAGDTGSVSALAPPYLTGITIPPPDPPPRRPA